MRISGFRGTWEPNQRPYISLTPDVYVKLQGQTSVIACGECKRTLNVNKYLTGISTEASTDSPPGSGSINLSIPDHDVNEFYVEGTFLIIPMMEIEIFAKGYYTVGGFPQYYRIFWGLVSNVTKSWNNGVTSVSLSLRDILRWWELTNVVVNPAFLDIPKTESNYNLFGNKFSGLNPYTVIIALAREAMGDFSITESSFTSFRPEDGAERQVIAQYAKDIMVYWQLKFGNIWNNLVLYGTSGKAYTFSGQPGNVSPLEISKEIFIQEAAATYTNDDTDSFKLKPHEIAAFSRQVARAGEVDFFQNETSTKLQLALTARDQAGGYEFFCDTTGDIVFKPPFYNLNVIPNKPVSWIQDFEIIDESISDNEAQVFTHITSHGNAFGGVTDWGINDDITTPRTGVIDWHLLKRYGWRRIDLNVVWAGNPRKLFYHCLDHLDKINAKRISGTITIPLRPELRLGFPVWIPSWDSFFYVSGISHQVSFGGQATTTLTLIAKRSKFVAPKNIGIIKKTGNVKAKEVPKKKPGTQKVKVQAKSETEQRAAQAFERSNPYYEISFPSSVGESAGLVDVGQEAEYGGPAVIRDPNTGKLLGFPDAVMVFRTSLKDQVLASVVQKSGSTKGKRPKQQEKGGNRGSDFNYDQVIGNTFLTLQSEQRASLIDRLRTNRYEWGFTSTGAYDYAHDENKAFKELGIIPAESIYWGVGSADPNDFKGAGLSTKPASKIVQERTATLTATITTLDAEINTITKARNEFKKEYDKIQKEYNKYTKSMSVKGNELAKPDEAMENKFQLAQSELDSFEVKLTEAREKRSQAVTGQQSLRSLPSLNVMVRPVSDEFGFEVIGHYRYGRGAFVDFGQVVLPQDDQIGTNEKTINELNIQFSPHGGLITDSTRYSNLGLESNNYARSYEKMQPEDYATGASFKGSNYNNDQNLVDVNYTGQDTFTKDLDRARETSHVVFVEADALRRAVSLAELKPTLESGVDAINYGNCSCELGRADWLSVLPKDFLQRVLRPTNQTAESELSEAEKLLDISFNETEVSNQPTVSAVSTSSPLLDSDGDPILGITRTFDVFDPNSPVGVFETTQKNPVETVEKDRITGSVYQSVQFNSNSFFDVLHDYLVERFNVDYGITRGNVEDASINSTNMERENFDTKRVANIVAPGESLTGKDVNNIIVPHDFLEGAGGNLFDRAAAGDPDSIEALQKGVNFNFGRTEQGVKKAKGKTEAAKKQASQGIKDLASSGKFIWDPTQFGKEIIPGVELNSGLAKQKQVQPEVDSVVIKLDPTKIELREASASGVPVPRFGDEINPGIQSGQDLGDAGSAIHGSAPSDPDYIIARPASINSVSNLDRFGRPIDTTSSVIPQNQAVPDIGTILVKPANILVEPEVNVVQLQDEEDI